MEGDADDTVRPRANRGAGGTRCGDCRVADESMDRQFRIDADGIDLPVDEP
jgi:hypothetical protein